MYFAIQLILLWRGKAVKESRCLSLLKGVRRNWPEITETPQYRPKIFWSGTHWLSQAYKSWLESPCHILKGWVDSNPLIKQGICYHYSLLWRDVMNFGSLFPKYGGTCILRTFLRNVVYISQTTRCCTTKRQQFQFSHGQKSCISYGANVTRKFRTFVMLLLFGKQKYFNV
jgi:hypothetical protein